MFHSFYIDNMFGTKEELCTTHKSISTNKVAVHHKVYIWVLVSNTTMNNYDYIGMFPRYYSTVIRVQQGDIPVIVFKTEFFFNNARFEVFCLFHSGCKSVQPFEAIVPWKYRDTYNFPKEG